MSKVQLHRRWVTSRSLHLFTAILATLALAPSCKKTSPPPGGQVHGFVVAVLKAAGIEGHAPAGIHLPNARVYLKALPSGTVVAGSETKTNPHGFFIIPKQPGGQYQICAEADAFVSQCDSTPISLSSFAVVLTHDLQLVPKPPGAIVGHVALKNGSICFQENPAFGTLVTSQVEVLDGAGTVISGPVTANSAGQFVVPKIPGPGAYRITGDCALGKGEINITVDAAALVGATAYTLTLDNSAPIILSVVPALSGKAVRRAQVGDILQVTVTANDPDGDTLHYQWASSTDGFVSADADTVAWHLPSVSATNAIYVQVMDGKGGFANQQLAVPTGISEVLFSGTVLDRQSHAPIAGAKVNIGSAAVNTNGAGAFLLSVPETERYVLNVKQPTYALLSQVFLSGTTGLQLLLDKAQRNVMDPREGGRGVYEGKNSGATVIIRAGTLVDGTGNPVTGSVNVDTFAYDIEQANPIPGDFSGKDLDGNTVRMETYGAVDVELTDGGGNPVRLGPGATADITLAIAPAFQAAAPATIPLLSYDQASGFWIQEGNFTRVGNQYQATVKHLSTFNADTVFSNTACIRMTAADTAPTVTPPNPPRFAPAFPFTLHVDYTAGGGPRHNDFQVPDEKASVLYRLPPNTDVTLQIVTAAGPSRTFTVKSGDAVPDAILDQNGVPPFDYGSCKGFDPNNPTAGNPVVLAVELPQHNVPYLGLPGTGSPTETIAYYKSIGAYDSSGNPTAARGTFSAWKATNGLSADPLSPVAGEARGIYFNNGDLQLGRDMHCIQLGGGPDAACYVTNFGFSVFGGPQGAPEGAIHDAIHNAAPLASVAMEYHHAEAPNAVRFFVFAASGSLLNSVALDTEGPKNVPHLCLACHGGSYDTTAHNVDSALFLPFDVFSYLYDQVEGHTLTSQQESFRQLNNIVKQTNPSGNAIQGLIDGLYPCGVGTSGCAAVDTPFTPSGWASNPALYQTVTRQYCRTCHVAQPSVDWTQASQWTGIASFVQSYVCNDPRHMPHAEAPYKKFWLSQSPHVPAFMFGPSGLNTGACPP